MNPVSFLLPVLWAFVSGRPDFRRTFNVTREFQKGDLFSNVNRCEPDQCVEHGAEPEKQVSCHCRCPLSRPIFLQHIALCTNSTGECEAVEFRSSHSWLRIAPTTFLPLQHHIINPSNSLDWTAAKITPVNGSISPCRISQVAYLSENGWQLLNPRLFEFTSANHNSVFLKWRGNEEAHKFLAGKLVQVSVRCDGAEERVPLCILFRVIGNDAMSGFPSASMTSEPESGAAAQRTDGSSPPSPANHYGLIVGIVCGALLALTLVGVAIFWVVCWKHHKDRLIRKLQLQFLYQHQFQQNPAVFHYDDSLAQSLELHQQQQQSEAECHNSEFYGDVDDKECWAPVSPNSIPLGHHSTLSQAEFAALEFTQSQEALVSPPPYPSGRKKLYFSPEFFEPELMLDPPPLAEEFLYEVRRMIDIAKNRIRTRRYLSPLMPIPEESLEDGGSQRADRGITESPAGSGGSNDSPDSGNSSGDSPSSEADKGHQVPSKPQADEKVSSWLNGILDQTGRLDSAPPQKPFRHSRLFKNFAARQAHREALMSVVEERGGEPDSFGTGQKNSSPLLKHRSAVAEPLNFWDQSAPVEEFWLPHTQEHLSRRRILASSLRSEEAGRLGADVIGVASLPRHFFRSHPFQNGASHPFADSLPRLHPAYSKHRPPLQSQTFHQDSSSGLTLAEAVASSQ